MPPEPVGYSDSNGGLPKRNGNGLPIVSSPNSSRMVVGGTLTEVEAVDVIDITSIEEALALIDQGLGVMTDRQLVSTSEVTDLLLDVRALLSDTSTS